MRFQRERTERDLAALRRRRRKLVNARMRARARRTLPMTKKRGIDDELKTLRDKICSVNEQIAAVKRASSGLKTNG
jgi:hypothetical protein